MGTVSANWTTLDLSWAKVTSQSELLGHNDQEIPEMLDEQILITDANHRFDSHKYAGIYSDKCRVLKYLTSQWF